MFEFNFMKSLEAIGGCFKLSFSCYGTPKLLHSTSKHSHNIFLDNYNLQGVRINNPENGIFIRRQGNAATKVTIK